MTNFKNGAESAFAADLVFGVAALIGSALGKVDAFVSTFPFFRILKTWILSVAIFFLMLISAFAGLNIFNVGGVHAAETMTYIQDDTAWDDFYIGGEGSVLTTDYRVGASSVKITTLQRSVYNGISKELLSSPVNLANKNLKMYVKSSDWSKVGAANLLLGSDGYSFSGTFTFDIKRGLQNPANGSWIELSIPLNAFEKYGNANWSAINIALLRIKDDGANAADLSMDGLGYYDTPAGQPEYIADNIAWDDFYIGGEGSVSNADYVTAASSVKITTLQRSVYNGISKELFASPVNLTNKSLKMYVKSSDWSKVGAANLLLGSDGYSFSNTYTFNIKENLDNPANNIWIELPMPLGSFEKYGNANWSAINIALLRIKDDGVNAADLSVDAISYVDSAPIPPGQFTYIEDDTAWNNHDFAGVASVSTTDYIVGKSSVKATTAKRSRFNGITKSFSASPLNFTGKAFHMYFKSSDWSKINAADLTLGSDGTSFNNTYTFDIKAQIQNPANNEWLEVVVPLSAFEKWGSPNWAAINIALLELKDTGSVANLSIDGLGYFDAGTHAGVVTITFDDGWADTYVQGKAKMDAYGYKGTAFIIPSLIGTTINNYMTQTQVDGLSAAGWDISGHGATNLTTFTDTQLESDLSNTRDYLVSKSYKGSNLYAFPNGATNSNVTTKVKNYFSYGFNIDGMNQTYAYMNNAYINRQGVDMWTPIEQVKSWIDGAKNNGEWCIINFHTLVTSPAYSYDYSITDFGTIIDYIKSSGVQVKTVSEVIGG